jgi:hypothetical protein
LVYAGATALIIAGVIVAAILFIRGAITEPILVRSIPALTGIATAIVIAATGISLGFRRYILAGIAGGLFSALLFWLPLGLGEGGGWLGLVWGVLLILTGSWSLNKALKERGHA